MSDPLSLAQQLIRCKSVTPDDDGAIAVLESFLTPLGFKCQRVPFGADKGRPEIQNLYARLGDAKPYLCFAGHTDVVPTGEGWSVDPFAGVVKGDILYGRGVVDMKGGIACFAAAVARYLQNRTLSGSISFLITGDEEDRALDGTVRVLDWMRERGEAPDFCVVGEPSSVEKIGDTIKIGRRGSLNGWVLVKGQQGHVAYPHLANNPIPGLLTLLDHLTGEPLDQGSPHFQPSNLEVTTIDVGNKAANLIPGEARARFNIRFNDHYSGKTLEEEIRRRLDRAGVAYDLDVVVSGESFLTEEGAFSRTISKAVAEVTKIDPTLNTTGGTSDARFIRALCPVVELGLLNKTAHHVDECAALADLENLTRIYERLIVDCMDGACSP